MVCQRCVNTVRQVLTQAGFEVINVRLGEAEIEGKLDKDQKEIAGNLLKNEGFELLDNRTGKFVEQIKHLIIAEIHHERGLKKETMNYSDFLSRQTRHDYSHLSKLFSSIEGITIEKYILAQKVERVKELLVYDELSLGEISFRLGYSSSQHLSNQFRQVTGMTPTAFKNTHPHDRQHLDHV